MRTVNVAELKNNLSRYLLEVRAGAEIIVRDRSVAVARLCPLEGGTDEDEQALVAEGKLRPAARALPRGFWSMRAPKVAPSRALAALAADRDE
jgi:prevent-host-death family protein